MSAMLKLKGDFIFMARVIAWSALVGVAAAVAFLPLIVLLRITLG